MYGRRDKGVDVTDYLASGNVLFFLNERLARRSYMLTEKESQLLGRRDRLNRNIRSEVFVLRRMDAPGKS